MGDSMPSAAHDPVGAEHQDVQDQVDKFQRHIEELLEDRDQEDVERIRVVVQQSMEKILVGKKFDGTVSGAVEASIKEANKRINAILAQEELKEEEEEHDEPAELEKKSGSLASAATEGFKFIGSFFAQAAMGGAELPDLMREEEQAYNSQAIVLPLRRLAESLSQEAEHDALVGGPGVQVPTTAAADAAADADVKGIQQHAKEVREAQQDALKKQTGDTLYPASGREEPVSNSAGTDESGRAPDSNGTKASAVQQDAPSEAEQLVHLSEAHAPGGLQEEDWSAPGRTGTAETPAPDVKGSVGHSAGL